MLFYLTNSLIASPEDADYNEIRKCVRKLATAVTESKHLLMGDYEVIRHFNQIFRTAEDEESRLFNRLELHEAFRSIPQEITYYVEIVRDNPLDTRFDGSLSIAQIKYDNFDDSRATQETVLLGEDTRDCEFYEHIYRWYVRMHKPTLLYHKMDATLGAGGHTSDQILKVRKNKRPCLAIVDTDKKYPSHVVDANTTCKKCQSIKENKIYKLHILQVQEIENLLPLEYIEWNRFNDVGLINKQHFDKLLNNAHTEYILQFLDLKEGIKKKNISGDYLYKTFAMYCFIHNDLINLGQSFDEYLASINDEDYIQRPLQSSLMKHVLEEVLKKEKQGIVLSPYLFDYQETEWKNIGQLLLDWGCARSNEAIV